MEELEFDGYEFDTNGRVIDPDLDEGNKIIFHETKDYCFSYEWLDLFHDGDLLPVGHIWVYNYSPSIKRELIEAGDAFATHFGVLFAIASDARPKLAKFINSLHFQIIDEEDGLQLYQWRLPNEVH